MCVMGEANSGPPAYKGSTLAAILLCPPTLFKTPFLPVLSQAVPIVFALPVNEFTLARNGCDLTGSDGRGGGLVPELIN